MEIEFNPTNLKIKRTVLVWNHDDAAAAIEGVTLEDGTEHPGFNWIGETHRRLTREGVQQMLAESLEGSEYMRAPWRKFSKKMAKEYNKTLKREAPKSDLFDYKEIADSLILEINGEITDPPPTW